MDPPKSGGRETEKGFGGATKTLSKKQDGSGEITGKGGLQRQKPLCVHHSTSSAAALGREQFGLELTAERLGPNGARLGQDLTLTVHPVRACARSHLAHSDAFFLGVGLQH